MIKIFITWFKAYFNIRSYNFWHWYVTIVKDSFLLFSFLVTCVIHFKEILSKCFKNNFKTISGKNTKYFIYHTIQAKLYKD